MQNKFTQKIQKFFKTDFGIALIIIFIWKIIMTSIGFIIDLNSGGATSIINHTNAWDSGWYITIINDHYVSNAVSAAFYPLFPLLVGLIHFASFGFIDILTSGQIINTISIWLAISALLKIAKILVGNKNKYWLVALLLSAPAAFFLHVFYSEALFMAVAFWAYYFALKHKWLRMGVLLAILTATRLPSILIIGLCGLEFMQTYQWNIRKIFNKNILYFLLAPIGFISYGLYLLRAQGDFFAMFSAYHKSTDWIYQVFDINIFKTMARAAYQVLLAVIGRRPYDHDLFINNALPIACISLLAICSIYLLIKHRNKFIPLGVFGAASIILFTINSNVVSAHRYVLPCITIYIALILFFQKSKYSNAFLTFICIMGISIQLMLFAMFINGTFAG